MLHAGKCLRFHCPGVPRKARTPSERRQPSLRPPCPVPIFPPPAKLPKFHFAKSCPALICLPMPWAVLPCCFAHRRSLHLKALPFLATQYSGPSFQTQSPDFMSSRKAAPGCPPGAEPALSPSRNHGNRSYRGPPHDCKDCRVCHLLGSYSDSAHWVSHPIF